MKYGHRRDLQGYKNGLEAFDQWLGKNLPLLRPDDLLVINADHGCDPTFKGSDHTREYIPILIYGKNIKKSFDLGIRETFGDIGATILEYLTEGVVTNELDNKIIGKSFWNLLRD